MKFRKPKSKPRSKPTLEELLGLVSKTTAAKQAKKAQTKGLGPNIGRLIKQIELATDWDEIEELKRKLAESAEPLRVVVPTIVAHCRSCGTDHRAPQGAPLVEYRSKKSPWHYHQVTSHASPDAYALPIEVLEMHTDVPMCEECVDRLQAPPDRANVVQLDMFLQRRPLYRPIPRQRSLVPVSP